MMTTCVPSETAFVTTKSGLAVSLGSVRLLWRLEDDGMVVKVDETGRLLVGPASRLTADDDRVIREYRNELIELVKMSRDEVVVG